MASTHKSVVLVSPILQDLYQEDQESFLVKEEPDLRSFFPFIP